MLYYHSYIETPIGLMQIKANETSLQSILFVEEMDDDVEENIHSQHAAQQLTEYFYDKRKVFDLPLTLDGTAFQQIVWGVVAKVPFAKSITYSKIAAQLNNA